MPKIALPKSFGLYTHGDGTRRSYPPSLPGLTMNLAVQEASDRLLAAASDPSGTDPFPYYATFDRNRIPWHTAAGGYGPQTPIQAAAAPNITGGEYTVTSLSGFNSALASGRRIIINGNWSASWGVGNDLSDVEIVLPAGYHVGAFILGGFGGTPTARVRLRGSTFLSKSGGIVGQIRGNGPVTDIHVDGVDCDGDSTFLTGETNQCVRPEGTRWTFTRTRFLAAGYGWQSLISTPCTHVVLAGCTMYAGAAGRTPVGYQEGWAIRNYGGPFTIVDCRIQSTRYNVIRMHTNDTAGELLAILDSDVVAVAEGRALWMWNKLNTDDPIEGDGAYIDNCRIYSYTAGGCGFGFEMSAADCVWSRVRNTQFFSGGSATIDQAGLNSLAASYSGDHDWEDGNTFVALPGTEPAWGRAGDPRALTLPNGLSLIAGEGSCPGYSW